MKPAPSVRVRLSGPGLVVTLFARGTQKVGAVLIDSAAGRRLLVELRAAVEALDNPEARLLCSVCGHLMPANDGKRVCADCEQAALGAEGTRRIEAARRAARPYHVLTGQPAALPAGVVASRRHAWLSGGSKRNSAPGVSTV